MTGAAMSSTAPTVSVCMPASRPSLWFGDAVRSVLGQTFRDFEVIVTDDSGGALAEVVKGFADPRLRYVRNPTRLGFAGNHCRAIDQARGTYVTFLHDDDAWEPEFLAKATSTLDLYPETGLLLAGAVEVDGGGAVLGPRPASMPPGLVPHPLVRMLDPSFMMLLPSLTMVRRTALDANIRPWPDVIAADLTMYVDIVQAGWQLYFLDTPLVRYRVHDGQIGTDALAHRHALVSVWKGYRFDDNEAETLRQRAVARALIGRAATWLRRREPARAREDLADARDISPTTSRARRHALQAVSWLPASFVPMTAALWAHLGRRHRHQGV
jgi:glycosyltransferase involved in cell wall biosynthesis